MAKVVDSLIVGAGISGLSLGYQLKQKGVNVLVTESQNRVGGNIITSTDSGFLWEEGPNSFAPTPDLLRLLVDVGLGSELILADRKLPRYVYWAGKLLAVPMSPGALISTKLLSFGGKLRAFFGALGFVAPAMGQQLSDQKGEETVYQFFTRHLGTEVMQRLIGPFVSGVYAGDPQKLSAASAFKVVKPANNYGGLLAGLIKSRKGKPAVLINPNIPKTKPGELGSFKTGLQALPKALASNLGEDIKLGWQLTKLEKTANHTYLATFTTPNGEEKIESRTVVLTTPAYVSSALLEPLNTEVSESLKEIYYPPVAAVVLAYPVSAFREKLVGFGNLIPRGQGIRILGTIWTSSLFPNRAPAGWQTVTNYIGGGTDPEIANLDNDQIAAAVHQDLRKILLKEDVAPKVLAVRLWKRAIPQYTLGHQDRLDTIKEGLKSLPGLYVNTNYLDGVSIGECAKRGYEKSLEICDYLQQFSQR